MSIICAKFELTARVGPVKKKSVPFAERDMAVLKYSADGHGKFLVAFRATMKSFADFLRFVGFDFPDGLGFGIFAMRADRAIRPKQPFEIVPRR